MVGVRVCGRACVRACVRSFLCSAPFCSIWPAFTLTVHINALYNDSVHRQEQHTSGINTIPYKIATLFTFTFAKLGLSPPTRCLRCATDYATDCARPRKVPVYDSLVSRSTRERK